MQFVKNLFLPGGFELDGFQDGNCDVTTATGTYSCLTVDMGFRRQISYYIITIYIPTFLIVMVSWMSFWLDHKSVSCIQNGSFNVTYDGTVLFPSFRPPPVCP